MDEIAAFDDGIYFDNFLILSTAQREEDKKESERGNNDGLQA